ncbi:MAG TPA: hypothetical protein VMP41_01260 [Acidimicrobiales bacterium]|nr:hypothetical protein [Acidimicrobiales bacterium]
MVSIQDPEVSVREAPPPSRWSRRREPWWWVPGAITVVTIAAVILVTLWQLHLSHLFSDTTTTGGDTGAHIAMPWYMRSMITHGHLTGWYPGWYDGMPLYTFYFTLPDFFVAVGSWIIPFNVAFKLGTILGSVLLPITAWACGRFFRLRPPIPTLLAAATLPFLFDYTYTIYGGNLFSTLAGEYAFSFGVALAILFLGLFAAAVREGRHRAWAAVVLAGCVLSHIVPGLYALGGAAVLTVIELLPARWGIGDKVFLFWRGDPDAVAVPRTRTLWRAVSTAGIGLLLTAFWLVPFGLQRSYATSMGYVNLTTYLHQLFPEADTWALVLAGIGVIMAVLLRSRFGLTVTVLGAAFALAEVFDPQGSLYNVRLLPMWFISVYLMAAWAFGVGCILVARGWRRARQLRWEQWEASFRQPALLAATGDGNGDGDDDGGSSADGNANVGGPAAPTPYGSYAPRRPRRPRWGPAAVTGAVIGVVAVMVVVVPPFLVSNSWGPVHLGPNEVTNWSSYNYTGYEGQSSYPEYRAVIGAMEQVSKHYGCGRTMWEYSDSENRFGTPEALMLLPYWTNGCIDSMEGLLFESSATTPYHFINQAELSTGPSEPEVGLPYAQTQGNVAIGVQHLQLLGVKYFLAESPEIEQQANANPSLQLVAKTGPWSYTYNSVLIHTTWEIYLVKNSPLVTPLSNAPAVLSGVDPAPSGWLDQSVAWYDHPNRWNVELAQGGPSSWPRTTVGDTRPPVRHVPTTRVTDVSTTDTTVSFHVSKVGTPVLVKVSYFPNWHASGANGPWRVTPNLMVVVPTSHDVTLSYGRSGVDYLGDFLTVLGVLALAALIGVPWWRSRQRRHGAHAAPS